MAEPAPLIPQSPALNTAEVVSLAEVAARRAEKFGKLIDTLDAGIAARATEAAEAMARAGFPRDQQRAGAEKATATARAEITKNSEEARWAALRELNAAADSIASTAALWASPVTVLARHGLGTPERTNYQQQLAGAGPVELTNMAQLATATGNKVLGAALLSIIDRMPAKSRPFSAASLADALVGEETRAMQAAVNTIRTAAQRALVRNREWERGRASPVDKIKLALNTPKE